MGYYTVPQDGTRNLVISDLIGPGPGAVHRRLTFEPDSEWQTHRVAGIYARSGRTSKYLGDWHTHPQGHPIPSTRDKNTLELISRYEPARCPEPIMLIAGNPLGSAKWELRAFNLQCSTSLTQTRTASLPLYFSD